MGWIQRARLALAKTFGWKTGAPAHRRTPRRVGSIPRRAYDNRHSLTRDQILDVLRRDGPMTRVQIQARLDVTTAGVHLPQMVRRGEVSVVPGTRPYVYVGVDRDRETTGDDVAMREEMC